MRPGAGPAPRAPAPRRVGRVGAGVCGGSSLLSASFSCFVFLRFAPSLEWRRARNLTKETECFSLFPFSSRLGCTALPTTEVRGGRQPVPAAPRWPARAPPLGPLAGSGRSPSGPSSTRVGPRPARADWRSARLRRQSPTRARAHTRGPLTRARQATAAARRAPDPCFRAPRRGPWARSQSRPRAW